MLDLRMRCLKCKYGFSLSGGPGLGAFLFGLLEIVFINIVLSGDNAVVIALACRNLPADQRRIAVFWGSFGAILLRVALTFVAVWALEIPFVQVAGGLLLIWIALKLLGKEQDGKRTRAGSGVGEAVRTIVIADLVMSLDNVIAVAGVAGGNYGLIGVGLAASIPLIVWGSQLLMSLMRRFPVIVWSGAGLLGYTAGEMIVKDEVLGEWMESIVPPIEYVLPIGLGLLIMLIGFWKNRRQHANRFGET